MFEFFLNLAVTYLAWYFGILCILALLVGAVVGIVVRK